MNINNIFQLAVALEVHEDRVSNIAKQVYKYTECGCVFNETPTGVTVCGYAEGADAECVPRALDYPFTLEEFNTELEAADVEGCEMFEEWNDCYPDDVMEDDNRQRAADMNATLRDIGGGGF